MKCEDCGGHTRLNWGDGGHIRCKACQNLKASASKEPLPSSAAHGHPERAVAGTSEIKIGSSVLSPNLEKCSLRPPPRAAVERGTDDVPSKAATAVVSNDIYMPASLCRQLHVDPGVVDLPEHSITHLTRESTQEFKPVGAQLATLEVVERVEAIEGSSTLERAMVSGTPVCIPSDMFQEGQVVVLVRAGSVVPDIPAFHFLKPHHYQVKPVTIAGQRSEGVLLPMSVLPPSVPCVIGEDVTQALGISAIPEPVSGEPEYRGLAVIEEIDNLAPIKALDKAEIATIRGFKVLVKKGDYHSGQNVIFIKPGCLAPPRPEFEFLRDQGYKIERIQQFDQWSEGVVLPLQALPPELVPRRGMDVTEVLGLSPLHEKAQSPSVASVSPKSTSSVEALAPAIIDQSTPAPEHRPFVVERLDSTDPLCGVEGWLAFFVMVQLFISPVLFIVQEFASWSDILEAAKAYPSIKTPMLADTLIFSVIIVRWIVIALHLRAIRPGVVQKTKAWLKVTVVVNIGWSILFPELLKKNGIPFDAAIMEAEMNHQVVLSVISFGIWYAYFSISKRVRATYPDWDN